MALLTFDDPNGGIAEQHPFTLDNACELMLGTALHNHMVLPKELGVAPEHAVIARSAIFQVPVLIDLTKQGSTTRLNGRQVVGLRVMRHRDQIELGKARLTFWEIVIQTVLDGSKLLGEICPFCYNHFRLNDPVVACPRCSAAHHKYCWFQLKTICSQYGCHYQVKDAMWRILAGEVRFERLEEGSELLDAKHPTRCGAGNLWDFAPFRADEHVVWCPVCSNPFHAECWLTLSRCPTCTKYDIDRLVHDMCVPAAGRPEDRADSGVAAGQPGGNPGNESPPGDLGSGSGAGLLDDKSRNARKDEAIE